jgi:hypothetical protein
MDERDDSTPPITGRAAPRLDPASTLRIAGTSPLLTPTIKSTIVESIMIAIKIRR